MSPAQRLVDPDGMLVLLLAAWEVLARYGVIDPFYCRRRAGSAAPWRSCSFWRDLDAYRGHVRGRRARFADGV